MKISSTKKDKKKESHLEIPNDIELKTKVNSDNTNTLTNESATQNPMLIHSLQEMDAEQRSRAMSTSVKEIAQKTLTELSFRKHIQFTGFIILFMLFIVAGGHFTIFFIYANHVNYSSATFQRINLPFVWIFLCFSIIYILRIVYILLTWKSNVKARA